MGVGCALGIAGQHNHPPQTEVDGGADDAVALRVEYDDGAGAGQLLDEPRGTSTGDDTGALGL